MKKVDIFLIIFFIFFSFSLSYYISHNTIDYNNKYLIIKVDNEVLLKKNLPIKGSEVIPIETEYGSNKVLIDKNVVDMIESDCYNQICVEDKKISKVGEVLVCLPHKLIVEIKGYDLNEVDINSY